MRRVGTASAVAAFAPVTATALVEPVGATSPASVVVMVFGRLTFAAVLKTRESSGGARR